jgi:hypothetical protein
MTLHRLVLAGLACLLLACSPKTPSPDATASLATASATGDAGAPARDAPAAPSPSGETVQNEWVLPGMFAPDTTFDALRDRFGAGQVRAGDVPGAEGESFRGVVLFPDDPAHRAYLYFQDEQSLRGLSRVRVIDATSRWRLDNGVAMGMALAELVRRNGKPIRYTGLGWDYGGNIEDLHEGTLARSQEGPVTRHWRLGPSAGADTVSNTYPVGEASFASDDPRYPRQGETVAVSELWVAFPGEDDL